MQHLQELKTKLFSQIVVVGRENSRLDAVAGCVAKIDTLCVVR